MAACCWERAEEHLEAMRASLQQTGQSGKLMFPEGRRTSSYCGSCAEVTPDLLLERVALAGPRWASGSLGDHLDGEYQKRGLTLVSPHSLSDTPLTAPSPRSHVSIYDTLLNEPLLSPQTESWTFFPIIVIRALRQRRHSSAVSVMHGFPSYSWYSSRYLA